jgi:hypothetical protein
MVKCAVAAAPLYVRLIGLQFVRVCRYPKYPTWIQAKERKHVCVSPPYLPSREGFRVVCMRTATRPPDLTERVSTETLVLNFP